AGGRAYAVLVGRRGRYRVRSRARENVLHQDASAVVRGGRDGLFRRAVAPVDPVAKARLGIDGRRVGGAEREGADLAADAVRGPAERGAGRCVVDGCQERAAVALAVLVAPGELDGVLVGAVRGIIEVAVRD